MFDRSVTIDAAALGAAGDLGNVAGTRHRHLRSGARSELLFGSVEAGVGRNARWSTWGSSPGARSTEIELDRVFIGSCTNARIEDLRAAAAVVRGRKVSSRIRQAMVVPGSGLVKRQAEKEGLARVFLDAGFEWRSPGCSMCLAMNADRLETGERCAATSNRNFEGRQGHGGRTHLVSPAMAAAAAVAGHFTDVRDLLGART